MNHYFALLLLLPVALVAQSLEPDTVLVDTSGAITHFAWRVNDQVPVMAKHLVKSKYSDSLETAYQNHKQSCDSLQYFCSKHTAQQRIVIQAQNQLIKTDSVIIEQKDRSIKQERLKRRKITLLAIGEGALLVVFTVFALVK